MGLRSSSTKSVTASVLMGLAAIGACAMLVNAVPAAYAPAPAPITAGIVNLEQLMNNLTELDDRNAQVKILRDEMLTKRQALADEIKQLETELQTSVSRTDMSQRVPKMAELAEKRQLLKVRSEGFDAQIDVINAQIIRELYAKVSASITAFAQREGYSLVMLDDRAIQLSPQMTSDQVNQVILNKRILYAEASIDVTERIATIMNNEYAAGKK
jgi:Skp family chaperone for outer membrane proteins